jgi:predicted DNA-binding transcriptional regulator AlpA
MRTHQSTPTTHHHTEQATHGASDGLLDRRAVCELLGGNKPLNPSTLYRAIKAGRFPKPIHVGGSSRWLRAECEAALRRMVEARS